MCRSYAHSSTTEAIDRGIKFEDYAAHGVNEYWIINLREQYVEQYELKREVYELVVKVRAEAIRSVTVEGFEIPVRAIFDENEHLTALQTILNL